MITSKLSTRFSKAKYIYKEEGLVTLLKRIFTFLLSYENNTFYVSEVVLRKGNEADFLPTIRDFTCEIVETAQQLDKLSTNGFDLSLLDITKARQRLEKGAIVVLIFICRELAYTGWMALNEEAKNTINHYPYKVDFSNNEACLGGAWTNPKFRRQGLAIYGMYKRREYLLSKGINKVRSITQTNNTAMLGAQKTMAKKSGERRTYSKTRYTRVGRLKFWKEKPFKETENVNENPTGWNI